MKSLLLIALLLAQESDLVKAANDAKAKRSGTKTKVITNADVKKQKQSWERHPVEDRRPRLSGQARRLSSTYLPISCIAPVAKPAIASPHSKKESLTSTSRST